MGNVAASELAEYSKYKTEVIASNSQDVIKAVGTMDQHDVTDFVRASPTEEELCQYYEEYAGSERHPELNPLMHEAAIAWAEDHC